MVRFFICQALAFGLVLITPYISLSQVVINEIMSSNTLGLEDDNGDTSDWLEFYNKGSEPVNLNQYGLSDDPADPFKWLFPSTLLNPGQFLLVFPSGESDRQTPYYWEALVTRGDVWRYRVNTSPLPVGWQALGFDDSSWPEGPSGFGYGDGDDDTLLAPCISASFRLEFMVEDISLVRYLALYMDYDDGYVAWLNGVPLRRENMEGTDEPAWDLPADDEREAGLYRDRSLSGGYVSDNALQTGVNVLAVQVHNESFQSDDLTCIPYLTSGLRPFEGLGGRAPAPEVVAKLVQLHTGFKLAVSGEVITLVDADGALVDQYDTGVMYSDVSRGRFPDGGQQWNFFTDPTPRSSNSQSGYNEFSSPVFFSRSGGVLAEPTEVALYNSDPLAEIYYSIDGSIPCQTSILYSDPLNIDETTVLRAVAFSQGKLPSRPSTASFILDVVSSLPTVSFVTDPINLWDPEYGIYAEENIFENWERPVHLEFFETEGQLVLNQDAGIKLFGAYSRTRPQKSFRLISRSGYGLDGFSHRILPEKNIAEFSQLVWRNAGNDFGVTHLRDGLMHSLVAETGIDYLAYRPSRSYLNGEYWGILNIRERIDEDYLASNHGLDPDEIDIMKNFWETPAGSSTGFWDMWDYMEDNDLADDAHFEHVATLMDVDNYADYQIIEIFAGNHDYGTNNIAWWRSQLPGGKWRWLLYDTEAGLGLQSSVEDNSLARSMLEDGSGWPSATFRSHILRNLTRNDNYKASFINRFCDYLNTTFKPARTLGLAETIAAGISSEIPRHMERWDRSPDWDSRMDIVYDFLERRPDLCRGFIQEQFDLGPQVTLDLLVEPCGAGSITLTAAVVDSAFSGIYFAGVPMNLSVEAGSGFAFTGWSDTTLASSASIVVSMVADSSLTALFVEAPVTPSVVINEINYHSSAFFDPGDWVELHNPGLEAVDLSGWVLKDGDDLHCFTFPNEYLLDSGGFLVLCADMIAFNQLFPNLEFVLGNLGFGFSGGGELVRVYDNLGVLQDSVHYDDNAPWPTEPDGFGATLILRDPFLDNSLAENWDACLNGGSPGYANNEISTVKNSGAVNSLGAPFPNPCNPRTEIVFSLANAQQVDLSVYDVRGRLVSRLAQGKLAAGLHEYFWDGLDGLGRSLPSGTYVFRLKLEELTLTRKTILLQ